jgi:YD repeat-containing protein
MSCRRDKRSIGPFALLLSLLFFPLSLPTAESGEQELAFPTDEKGRVAFLQLPSGQKVVYEYDEQDRLIARHFEGFIHTDLEGRYSVTEDSSDPFHIGLLTEKSHGIEKIADPLSILKDHIFGEDQDFDAFGATPLINEDLSQDQLAHVHYYLALRAVWKSLYKTWNKVIIMLNNNGGDFETGLDKTNRFQKLTGTPLLEKSAFEEVVLQSVSLMSSDNPNKPKRTSIFSALEDDIRSMVFFITTHFFGLRHKQIADQTFQPLQQDNFSKGFLSYLKKQIAPLQTYNPFVKELIQRFGGLNNIFLVVKDEKGATNLLDKHIKNRHGHVLFLVYIENPFLNRHIVANSLAVKGIANDPERFFQQQLTRQGIDPKLFFGCKNVNKKKVWPTKNVFYMDLFFHEMGHVLQASSYAIFPSTPGDTFLRALVQGYAEKGIEDTKLVSRFSQTARLMELAKENAATAFAMDARLPFQHLF